MQSVYESVGDTGSQGQGPDGMAAGPHIPNWQLKKADLSLLISVRDSEKQGSFPRSYPVSQKQPVNNSRITMHRKEGLPSRLERHTPHGIMKRTRIQRKAMGCSGATTAPHTVM